jgi:hypothetical protein
MSFISYEFSYSIFSDFFGLGLDMLVWNENQVYVFWNNNFEGEIALVV